MVTMATVRAPSSLARAATTGAAPVPVPPPRPAATKTMSAPSRISMMRSVSSSAAWRPISGSEPAPSPWVMRRPRRPCWGRGGAEGLGVGVEDVELNAGDAGLDHAVDGVGAAAADADDLDAGAAQVFILDFELKGVEFAHLTILL
jgi:hypothetical protein